MSNPWSPINFLVHITFANLLSIEINFAYVGLLEFTFCFVDLLKIDPEPVLNVDPVWLFKSLCVPNDESIYQYNA